MVNRENFLQKFQDRALKYKPFDPNELFLNKYFLALVNKTDIQRGYFSMIMKDHLNESKDLIMLIKSELKE